MNKTNNNENNETEEVKLIRIKNVIQLKGTFDDFPKKGVVFRYVN